jgi:hypothetical protein
MCDSCADYLRRIGCVFELERDFELVNAASAESAEYIDFVHVGSAESAESAEAAEYIDFVSVDVIFVEFARLGYDDLESADSGELGSEKSESKELRKSLHYDVSQPKQREIEVYGICGATERAESDSSRTPFVLFPRRSTDEGLSDITFPASTTSTPTACEQFAWWTDMEWLLRLEDISFTKWQSQSAEEDM